MGVWDVDFMLGDMPNTTWHEWLAFMELEPQTDMGVVAQLANKQAMYFNVNTPKGTPTKSQKDFLPSYMVTPPTQAQPRSRYAAIERQHIRTIDRAANNGR